MSALARRIGDLRGAARQRLERTLPTGADGAAFVTDYFPHIRACFGDGMYRTQKLNLLLERVDPDELEARLESGEKHPDGPLMRTCDRHIILRWSQLQNLGHGVSPDERTR